MLRMPKPTAFRALGLMALTLGVLVTLGRLLVQPPQSQRAAGRPLPPKLQISDWQPTHRTPLAYNRLSRQYDVVLDAQEYHFHPRSERLPEKLSEKLTVQLHYIVNTDASLGTFQQTLPMGRSPSAPTSHQTSAPTSARTHRRTGQLPELGHYMFSSASQEAILDTCINPQGQSTVTRAQFLDNRLQYNLRPIHLLGWAIGQNLLLDKRCIWMRLKLRSPATASPSTLPESLHQAWTELTPQLTSILQ